MMTRYAFYARTSSDSQRKEESITTQLSVARDYAAAHDLKLSARYLDDGVSGTVPFASRPQSSRLLADARAGKFSHLLIYDYTRLGRTALDVLTVSDELEQLGVHVVSIREPMPGGSDVTVGSLLRTVLAGFSQYGKDKIRADSMSGKIDKAALGRWQGGKSPFGYRVENKLLAVEEDEAAVVKEIFRLISSGDYSTRSIAALLNARGTFTPRGFRDGRRDYKWTPSLISQMLRNPVYRGELVWRKTTPVAPNARKRVPSAPHARVAATAPALVTAEEFDEAARLLKRNLTFADRNAKRFNLLRGLIKCGVCGKNYVCGTATPAGRRKRKHSYRCHSVYTLAKSCGNAYVSALALESLVWEWCAERIALPDEKLREVSAALARRSEPETPDASRPGEIKSLLAEKAQARARVINLLVRGLIDEREGERELESLRAEENALGDEARALEKRATAAEDSARRPASMRELLGRLRKELARADDHRRREIINVLLEKIVVVRGDGAGARPALTLYPRHDYDGRPPGSLLPLDQSGVRDQEKTTKKTDRRQPSDRYEIRVVGELGEEALFAARLTVLGFSREEVREAVRRLRARKAREAGECERPLGGFAGGESN